MKAGKLKKLIRRRVEDITALSKPIAAGFDKEKVHDFRVAVKTLRSLLRMLRLHIDDDRLKIPKKVKQLYHIAGEIRDIQLEMEMLADRNLHLPHYLQRQEALLEDQKAEWDVYYSPAVFTNMRRKLLKVKYDAIHPGLIAHFYETRLATINQLSEAAATSDDEMHNIRKQAKDVLYTTKFARKRWKAARKKVVGLPVEELDKLASAIGNYNDERQIAMHVDAFQAPQLTPEEEALIKSFCKQETVILQEEKHELIGMVKQLNTKTA